MNPSNQTRKGERKPRFDMDDAVSWVEDRFDVVPPANPKDGAHIYVNPDDYFYTDEGPYVGSVYFTHDPNYSPPGIAYDTNLFVVDEDFPIDPSSVGVPINCRVQTGNIDGFTPQYQRPAARATSPSNLQSGYSGTVEGVAPAVPNSAEQELYTTFRNVSHVRYEELNVAFYGDDGEPVYESIQKSRVRGRLSASSGTVNVYVETDQLYHLGSGPVESDGTFSIVFDRDPNLTMSTLRLTHPSTRMYEQQYEGEYIFSNYRAVPYMIVDQPYKQTEEVIFTSDKSWKHSAGGFSGVWEVRLERNGNTVGIPWRNYIGTDRVISNLELVAWQRKLYDMLDPDPSTGADRVYVTENGDAQFVGRGIDRPFRLGLWSNGSVVNTIWHEDVNQSNHYDDLFITDYEIDEIPYVVDQRVVPADGEFTGYKEPNLTMRWDLDDRRDGVNFEYDFEDPWGFRNRTIDRTQTVSGMPISYPITPEEDPDIFWIPFAERCYAYDAALVLLWACFAERKDIADNIVRAWTIVQEDNGLWPFFVTVGQFKAEYLYERTGASMWLNEAFIEYCSTWPNSQYRDDAKAAVDASFDRIINEYRQTDPNAYNFGLYRGGRGAWVWEPGENPDDATFDADVEIPWVSTEHTVDTFFAFLNYYETFGGQEWYDRAEAVYEDAIDVLWFDGEQRFYQGAAPNGPDTRGALDVHSWGSVMLHQAGDFERRDHALNRIPLYLTSNEVADNNVRGYPPYIPAEGHDVDARIVWFEGTYGVGFAQYRAGRKGEGLSTNHEIAKEATDDGGYRYALRRGFEMTTFPAMASTVWALFALRYPDELWRHGL